MIPQSYKLTATQGKIRYLVIGWIRDPEETHVYRPVVVPFNNHDTTDTTATPLTADDGGYTFDV